MVELINIGLNPRCKVTIAGLGNLRTVREYELVCTHNQNIEVSNELRMQNFPRFGQNSIVNPTQKCTYNRLLNFKSCFSSGKKGPFVRQCC